MTKRKQNLKALATWLFATTMLVAIIGACIGVNVGIINNRAISDGAAVLALVPTAAVAGFFLQRQWAWGLKVYIAFKYE